MSKQSHPTKWYNVITHPCPHFHAFYLNCFCIKLFDGNLYLTEHLSMPKSLLTGVNVLRLKQNCRHFAANIFKYIFLRENLWIFLKISLKFFPKVWICNIPALVQIMAWCRPDDKPLSEPMVVSLPTHTCVNQPQWVHKRLFCCRSQTC